MDDFNSETDSDYTSYWRDWVSISDLLISCFAPSSFVVVRTGEHSSPWKAFVRTQQSNSLATVVSAANQWLDCEAAIPSPRRHHCPNGIARFNLKQYHVCVSTSDDRLKEEKKISRSHLETLVSKGTNEKHDISFRG